MDHIENEQFREQAAEPDMAPLKHSGLGITSFIMAAAAMLFVLLGIICIVSIGMSTLEGIGEGTVTEEEIIETAPMLIIGVLLYFASVLIAFVGCILGIVGLVQRNRKKLFAILGTILNGLMVLFVVFMMVIGIIAQGQI